MKNSKLYNIMPFIIALFFAILAYYFYPINGDYDLSKYYHLMDLIKLNDAETLMYINNYFEILFRFYMYLIAFIGNYRLLQFFPVLFLYLILCYIIFDYGKNHGFSKLSIVIISMLCLSLFRFVLIASSIRYAIAYVIFALALYLDLIKKDKRFWVKLLYILPIFLHKTSIIFLLLRLLIEIKNKKIIYFIFGISTILFFFPNFVIEIITPFKNIKIVESLINMIYGYLIEENVPIYLQLIFRLFQTTFFTLCGVLCYLKTTDNSMKKYYIMLVLVGIFTICLFNYFTIFMRMIDFLVFMSPIVIFECLRLIHSNEKLKLFYPLLLLLLGVFIVCGIYIQIIDFKGMYF